ncbi:hypothetical protein R6Q59_006364 [Mikania micrantha]
MKAFFWEGQLGELALGKEFHSAGTGKVAIPLKVYGWIRYAVFTDKSIRLLGKNQYTSNVESGSTRT